MLEQVREKEGAGRGEGRDVPLNFSPSWSSRPMEIRRRAAGEFGFSSHSVEGVC